MKSDNNQKANKTSFSGLKTAGFKESRAGLDPALLLCCYIHILGPNVCRSKCKLCFTEIGFVYSKPRAMSRVNVVTADLAVRPNL